MDRVLLLTIHCAAEASLVKPYMAEVTGLCRGPFIRVSLPSENEGEIGVTTVLLFLFFQFS